MLDCREWDGTAQDLLHAIACAVFQFSATPQPECRDMLSAGLMEWLSTAREPKIGDRGLPQPAW